MVSYYGGGGAGHQQDFRTKLLHHFAAHDGFGKLLHALQAQRTPWIGAEDARLLMQAAADAAAGGVRECDSVPADLCQYLLEPLQRLTEEELKVRERDMWQTTPARVCR